MADFHEICARDVTEEMIREAERKGWDPESFGTETVFLSARDWGCLKREIRERREEADVLVYEGGDEEMNRKVCGDSRLDILIHPGKGRKDSGFNHVMAEEAAENRVALGLDFSRLWTSDREQSHVMSEWRRNLKICEKYGVDYVLTTKPEDRYELRAPRDLAAILNVLGHDGEAAVTGNPGEIISRNRERTEDSFVRPGVREE
ncbi:MAG: RNase P subunit p30 family protein [Candidatus Nanohaloarchaea archaeon]